MTTSNNVIKIEKKIDSKLMIKPVEKRTVLICLNSFQTMDTHDSKPLLDYFENTFKKDYPLCEIDTLLLFEPSIKKSHKAKLYKKIVQDRISFYKEQGYDIILLGYSFSCALASEMSVKNSDVVKKLILVAPIYDTILNGMIPAYIKYALKFSKLKKKYGAKVSKAIGRQTVEGMIGLLLSILKSILSCRKYYKKVSCDSLIIRGEADIMCTAHSLKKVDKKIKGKHNIYSYSKLNHSILKSIRSDGAVFEDILNFAFDTPYLISREENIKKIVKKDRDIAYDEDGNRIPTIDEIFDDFDPEDSSDYLKQQEDF